MWAEIASSFKVDLYTTVVDAPQLDAGSRPQIDRRTPVLGSPHRQHDLDRMSRPVLAQQPVLSSEAVKREHIYDKDVHF
jgi:hypothetical protein